MWANCLTKRGREVAVHIQQVVRKQHLAIDVRPRAYAQDGNAHGLGHGLGDAARYALKHDGEDARRLQRLRVRDELCRALRRAALHLEAAEAGGRLRRQADVAHDGDAHLYHAADGLCHGRAAFQLDAVAVRLHEDAAGAAYGLLRTFLIAAEGHVAHDEGVRRALNDGADVVYHVVERDADGGVVAQHYHAQRVAHEHDLRLALVYDGGRGVVVGRDIGKLAPLLLVFLEIRYCHLFL